VSTRSSTACSPRCSDLDAHDFAFVKRGSALLLEIERHFELEEGSVFARMREELPEAELIELGRRAMEAGDAPAE
jgi:hypothetical protein